MEGRKEEAKAEGKEEKRGEDEAKEVGASLEHRVAAGMEELVKIAGWDPTIKQRIKTTPNGWQLVSV